MGSPLVCPLDSGAGSGQGSRAPMVSSWSLRLSLLALALVVVGPLLTMAGIVHPLTGLGAFGVGAVVGLVGMVAGVVTAVRGRMKAGLVGSGLGFVAFAVVVLAAFGRGQHPPINDLTTDLEDVPTYVEAPRLRDNQRRDFTYRRDFVPIVRRAHPDLAPLTLAVPPERAYALALALAREQPRWEVTREDAQALTFEAVATSLFFRFPDDVVVRVRPTPGGGARVDMRSKSRLGRGDLGANAARIHHLFEQLKARASAG